jgi:hypothetical protein
MGPRSSSQYLGQSPIAINSEPVERDALPHILLFPRLKILGSQTVPLFEVHAPNILIQFIIFSQFSILGVGWLVLWENLPECQISTTNLTWINSRLNLGRCGEKPATNRLRVWKSHFSHEFYMNITIYDLEYGRKCKNMCTLFFTHRASKFGLILRQRKLSDLLCSFDSLITHKTVCGLSFVTKWGDSDFLLLILSVLLLQYGEKVAEFSNISQCHVLF